LWTTRHKGKWFFFNIFHLYNFSSRLLFLWHILRVVRCGVEEVGSGSFSYVKKDTKSKCRMVVFFINIYKQVIFQHECIVSPVQSASGKALHCAWHFHRRNSIVLAYIPDTLTHNKQPQHQSQFVVVILDMKFDILVKLKISSSKTDYSCWNHKR
jgi:hypothetical protein